MIIVYFENRTLFFTKDLLDGWIVGFELGFMEGTVEGWTDGLCVGRFDGIANSKKCARRKKEKLV